MKIKSDKEKDFAECVEVNSHDEYSKATLDYAIHWAELMEERIAEGEKISDIAEKTSQEADTEGITGFMYGCAVNMLRQFWEYGNELNQWHNSQYGYKGEGTVNPAVLTIG